MNLQQEIEHAYGCDIDEFIDQVRESAICRLAGGWIVVLSLMTEAQQQIALGDQDGAQRTLNRAKRVLMMVKEGALPAGGPLEGRYSTSPVNREPQ